MSRKLIRPLSLVCIVFLMLGIGCAGEKSVEEKTTGKIFEIEREYKRGPTAFKIRVSEKEISIAERLDLSLEVRIQEEYEVKMPEFGEKLEQFGIVDYHSPPVRLVEGGMALYEKHYELEPFLSGEYIIPPMKIVFWKKGEGEKETHEMESEPITISVKSLLPEKAAELAIEEIVPPMELPRAPFHWLIPGLGILAIAAGGVVYWIWRKRRAVAAEAVRREAHETAFEEMEALISENLLEKGAFKLFYLRLSGILRHYIENRFGLHAPERTTEEFLPDLRSTDVLISEQKNLLTNFLRHCDSVKFAEHQPTNEEIQETFDSCKNFIAETEVREESAAKAL